MVAQTTQARFGIKITTVDPLQGIVRGVMKADAQERPIATWTIPNAFRWPQVGESWMVEQQNGTWYLDSAWATAAVSKANPGDLVLTAPTGVVRVVGSSDGSTDFKLAKGSDVNVTPTIVNGTTAGTATYTQPFAGSAYKKVMVYLNGYENTTVTAQTISFPTAFLHTPYLAHDDSGGASVNTTQLTLPISMVGTKTGWIVVEGY